MSRSAVLECQRAPGPVRTSRSCFRCHDAHPAQAASYSALRCARKRVAGEPKRYEYPRWQFTNRSEDVQGLCGWALDLVGVAWRRSGWDTIAVSRREAVARLDDLIGPKR